MPNGAYSAVVLFVVTLSLGMAGCGDGATSLDAEVHRVLENADSLAIFAIEPPYNFAVKPGGNIPKPTKEKLYEYPIYGSVDVTDDSVKKEVVARIYEGLVRARKESKVSAKCFLPRHAIRATDQGVTVELLICFECALCDVFVDGEQRSSIVTTNDARDLLNRLLKDANVPLSPGSEEATDAHTATERQ